MRSSPTSYFFIFFFQAEDGIRDLTVTGVQTCALPISRPQSLLILLSDYFLTTRLGQFEINRNFSLHANRCPIQTVRTISPLPNRIQGCASEDWLPANHL